jgi:hypothetical protein
MGNRVKESIAMMMIGDGVLGIAHPKEHCLVWLRGPKSWRRTVRWFVQHPHITRAIGVGETVVGLWWSFRLRPTQARS